MSSIAWCIPTNTSHSWDSKGRAVTTSIWASVAFFISLVLIRCHRPRFHSVCCSWTARHVFHTSRKHSRSERRLLKINDQRHKVSASRYGWGNVFSFVHNKEEPSLHKCGNVITGSCTPQVGWKFPRGKSQSTRICGWQKPLIYPYPHRRNSLSFSLNERNVRWPIQDTIPTFLYRAINWELSRDKSKLSCDNSQFIAR